MEVGNRFFACPSGPLGYRGCVHRFDRSYICTSTVQTYNFHLNDLYKFPPGYSTGSARSIRVWPMKIYMVWSWCHACARPLCALILRGFLRLQGFAACPVTNELNHGDEARTREQQLYWYGRTCVIRTRYTFAMALLRFAMLWADFSPAKSLKISADNNFK